MTIRFRSRRGQAAVEGLLSIPVLMVIFMIGFELWGITWDAQYVNIKARYNVIAQEDKQIRNGGACTTMPATATMTFPANNLPLIGQSQQNIQLKSDAWVVCDAP